MVDGLVVMVAVVAGCSEGDVVLAEEQSGYFVLMSRCMVMMVVVMMSWEGEAVFVGKELGYLVSRHDSTIIIAVHRSVQ